MYPQVEVLYPCYSYLSGTSVSESLVDNTHARTSIVFPLPVPPKLAEQEQTMTSSPHVQQNVGLRTVRLLFPMRFGHTTVPLATALTRPSIRGGGLSAQLCETDFVCCAGLISGPDSGEQRVGASCQTSSLIRGGSGRACSPKRRAAGREESSRRPRPWRCA